MSMLYLTGFKGKIYPLKLDKSINDTTVSELLKQISVYSGCDNIDIYYNGKVLRSTNSSGKISNLTDYDIVEGIQLTNMVRLNGGGGPLDYLIFPDVTSGSLFKDYTLNRFGPKYRRVKPGLIFFGICKTKSCEAYKESSCIPIGNFSDFGGKCSVNEEIENLKCPICHNVIISENCTGMGIFNCTAEIESKTKDNKISKVSIIASAWEFKGVETMDKRKKKMYKYITIILSDYK